MNSWLDLEKRFRNLMPALSHCRLDAQWGAAGEYWHIAGGDLPPASNEFEILSTLAGQLLQRVLIQHHESEKVLLSIADPKICWYNALKSMSPSFGYQSYAEQINKDGTSAGFIFTGTVRPMAEAAANLCLALHVAHPTTVRTSKWRWIHDNYIKAIILGAISAVIAAIVKIIFA